MKYALIGCGRISPNHIQAARNNGLKIVALCDLDREAAIRLIRQFELEGVAVYADPPASSSMCSHPAAATPGDPLPMPGPW